VERFPAQNIYDASAKEIAVHLDKGEDVVVLCEGDPFFYGSFMYLFERLSGKYSVEVVPGISSLMASAAMLQRPLAARNDILSVIPAPLADEQILAQLEASDAVAIIKVGRHFSRIKGLIAQLGLTASAGYLERVTLENQKVMRLEEVSEDIAPYFSIILIYKGAENWIASTDIPAKHLGHSDA
jgi:precorrin-2/cobalt-factor-2 C20-methyltransferase